MTEMNTADQIDPPMPALAAGFGGFRLFLDFDAKYAIGGTGTVFGSTSLDFVHVLDVAGTIMFDPSFNAGGDFIGLPGSVENWQVQRSGSTARFSDGDTVVQVPVGLGLTGIGFEDTLGGLQYDPDSDSIKLSDQVIGQEFEPVLPVFDERFWGNDVFSGGATGRLFLSPGGEVRVKGDLSIFGTAESEHIVLNGGRVDLDPSFNRGGDILTLGRPAPDFHAVVEGSRVKLTAVGYDISIPVGTVGMELEFADDSRTLRYDGVNVLIGDQIILAEGEPVITPAASSLIGFG